MNEDAGAIWLITKGLDCHDRAKNAIFKINDSAQKREKNLLRVQAQFGQEFTGIQEIFAQDYRNRENILTVRHVIEDLLP